MFARRRVFCVNLLTDDHLALLLCANRLMSEGQPPQAAPRSVGVAGVLNARATLAFDDGKIAQSALLYAKESPPLFIVETPRWGVSTQTHSRIFRTGTQPPQRLPAIG
jgi:hypothetical protein